MNILKKIISGFIIFTAVLLAVLIALYYLTPRIINSETIKGQIQTSFTEQTGGMVEFLSLDVSYFPSPRVTINQGDFSIPDTASAAFYTITIYPKILSLFTGKLHIAKIGIESPELTLDITETPDKDKTQAAIADGAEEKLAAMLTVLQQIAPDLKVTIEKGSLNLIEADESFLSLSNINAAISLQPEGIRIDMSCSSNCRLALHNLTIIKSSHIKAAIDIDKNKSALTLKEMNLDYPKLTLSGQLTMDKTSKQIGLTLEASEVDVDSTREAVLSIAGDNATVRDIFNILRGGTVPLVTFTSHGNAFDELYDTDNFVVKGAIREGKIHVPGPDLGLTNVKGEVVVKKGILEGSNVASELEGARGTNGIIRIGLTGGDAPLHVETIVTTDPGLLPPLLRRLVKNEVFLKEINNISEIKGMATGKLILGDSIDSIRVGVDISEINLSANYRRLPYPLKIKGGEFSYDETTVSVKNMSGEMGKSSFSNLNARLSLGQDYNLQIHSGNSVVFMDEMYPWITSFEGPDVGLEKFTKISGTLNINSLTLEGPLLKPGNWHFSETGEVQSLVMETTFLPDSIRVSTGKIEIDEEKIFLTDNQIKIMDASLSVSGTLDRYMEGIHKADLTFSGDAGAVTAEWTSELINLPSELRVRPPVSISQAHLIWEKDNATSLKCEYIFQKGPALSLDIIGRSNELIINNLHIKDHDSDAALALTHKGEVYDFNFIGNLTASTLDKIFSKEIGMDRWVKGDFTAHILTDQPMRSSFQGKLEGKNILFPWELKVPLTINSISLDAGKNVVKVDSAELMFGNTHISLKGDIIASEKAFLFDMDIFSDGVEWDTIKKAFEKDIDDERTTLFGDLPVKGNVRLDLDYFTFDTFTWKPFRADISFDQEHADVMVRDADLCGISFPGVMKVTSEEMSIDFQPTASNKEIEPAIACLFDINKYMTGKFDLNGEVTTKGRNESLIDSLNADLSLMAKDGRIYQYGLISKVFAFLNLTETFRGRLPDLVKEGFAYKTITARAAIEGSNLNIKEFVIDASSMGIASHGNIDFIDKKVDLKVLVAPLKTVDFIVKKTPVIGGILGGTLISIPVRVKGDISDPDISYLSVSTAGSRLFDIMKNVLYSPVKIIQPIMPDGKEKE